MSKKDPSSFVKGCSIDIGTMNLVSARRTSSGLSLRRMRDVFLDLPLEAKKMLKLSGAEFIEREDDIIVVGDAAMEIASIYNKEVRRPLASGLVAAGEMDAVSVLGMLIKTVLGEPICEGEACYFSVPANPIDQLDRDVIYHTGIFDRILTEMGYTAYASNEAMAIIYSETVKEQFSGIGISFGSGMVNVALAVNAMEGLSFSVARSGDWIDSGAAKSLGSTQSRMCSLKEKGINLMDPKSREEEALVFYYKNMIEYVIKHFTTQFKENCHLAVPRPLPIIISGGTSLAEGFVDLFKVVFKKHQKHFPVQISEIRHAGSPLNAVAQGLLVQAMQEYED